MRVGRNTLNNMMMSNNRKTQIYQTLITDLVISGNISKEDGEMLLGYEIPNYLKTPDGRTLSDTYPENSYGFAVGKDDTAKQKKTQDKKEKVLDSKESEDA